MERSRGLHGYLVEQLQHSLSSFPEKQGEDGKCQGLVSFVILLACGKFDGRSDHTGETAGLLGSWGHGLGECCHQGKVFTQHRF